MSKLKKMPFNMKIEHYTHRITWSAEDEEYLGLCAEFSLLSLLSWLAGSPEKALSGIRQLVAVVVADMSAQNEVIPVPLAERHDSGQFRIRIPP